MSFLKNKFLSTGLVTAGIILLLAPFLFSNPFFNPLENLHLRLSNFLFTRNEPSPLITIIAIDDKSLDSKTGLGAFKDWSRQYYVQLLERLTQYEPKVIGFDLDWSKYSQGLTGFRLHQLTSASERGERVDFYALLKNLQLAGKHPDDVALKDALDKAPIVLGMNADVFSSEKNRAYYEIANPPIFSDVETGFLDRPRNEDDVRRKMVFSLSDKDGQNVIKSFPIVVAEKFGEIDDSFMIGEPGKSHLINFAARPNFYRTLSFVDVLQGKFSPEDVKGKILLVGATAPILHDRVSVPNSKIPMAGVEVHANVIQQILEFNMLNEPRFASNVGMIAAISALETGLVQILPMILSPIIFLGFLAAFAIGAKLLFDVGFLLNLVYPLLTIVLAFLGGILLRYFGELKEKRAVKKAFSHYVNKEVVAEILKHPEKLRLGGEKRNISVLFTDIISFTSLAEKMDPQTTVTLLNEYLDVMARVILAHGGTLDKFEGDAIMAFFGAPLENPLHAKTACLCALEMRRALSSLHEKWHREGKTLWDFCVGISTGDAVVGNLGSLDRFDYTAIGDTVNLGSRLESVNRLYGTKIIVDENTMQSVPDLSFRKLDRVRVKGKSKPVVIYELLASSNFSKDFLQDFSSGLKLYEERQFEEAKKHFQAALRAQPSDGPSQIYSNRCLEFAKTPPPENWDFVVDITQK